MMKLKYKSYVLISKSGELFFIICRDIVSFDVKLTGIGFVQCTYGMQQRTFA